MPEIRQYLVTQTREVKVTAENEVKALHAATVAFENPGQPDEGMSQGVHGMPKITNAHVERIL